MRTHADADADLFGGKKKTRENKAAQVSRKKDEKKTQPQSGQHLRSVYVAVSHGSSVCAVCSLSRMRYPAYSCTKKNKRVRHDKTLYICINTASYTSTLKPLYKHIYEYIYIYVHTHTHTHTHKCINIASHTSSQANI